MLREWSTGRHLGNIMGVGVGDDDDDDDLGLYVMGWEILPIGSEVVK
jgi:hypothetical protein